MAIVERCNRARWVEMLLRKVWKRQCKWPEKGWPSPIGLWKANSEEQSTCVYEWGWGEACTLVGPRHQGKAPEKFKIFLRIMILNLCWNCATNVHSDLHSYIAQSHWKKLQKGQNSTYNLPRRLFTSILVSSICKILYSLKRSWILDFQSKNLTS